MFRSLTRTAILAVALVILPTMVAGQTAKAGPTAVPAAADNQALDEIKTKAIVVHIAAKIIVGTETIWSAEQNRVTVHGLPVPIQMENDLLLINTEITPYRQNTGELLLVIKSDLWRRSADEQRVQYISSLRSAQVSWGESMFFYPLGDAVVDGRPRIIMEISLTQYQNAKD